MTARSKGQRIKNRKLKAEKLKGGELKRLRKMAKGKPELMEICGDIVEKKTVDDIKMVIIIRNT